MISRGTVISCLESPVSLIGETSLVDQRTATIGNSIENLRRVCSIFRPEAFGNYQNEISRRRTNNGQRLAEFAIGQLTIDSTSKPYSAVDELIQNPAIYQARQRLAQAYEGLSYVIQN